MGVVVLKVSSILRIGGLHFAFLRIVDVKLHYLPHSEISGFVARDPYL